MKYLGMSAGMWMLFSGSFQKQLVETLGYDPAAARQIAKSKAPVSGNHRRSSGI